MVIKKTALIGAVALLALPLSALALDTWNDTDEPSTVQLTTGSHRCSSAPPAGDKGVTPARTRKHIDENTIKMLCVGSPGKKCKANIHMTNNCTGDVVGLATLDMNSGDIEVVDIKHPRYEVMRDGFASMSAHYRKPPPPK